LIKSNYTPTGKCIIYVKNPKDLGTSRGLVHKGLGTRVRVIDEFVEVSIRKNYKPVLEQAVAKCNEKAGTHLVVANVGHLPRSLAFCNACMKLDGDDPYIITLRSTDHRVEPFKYHVRQMYFQCLDYYAATSKKAKTAIAAKKATGWKAGNITNLNVATIKASRAREKSANDYCKAIIPEVRRIQRYGKVTLQEIANALMAQNIRTRRDKETWTPMGVSNILNKAKKLGL